MVNRLCSISLYFLIYFCLAFVKSPNFYESQFTNKRIRFKHDLLVCLTDGQSAVVYSTVKYKYPAQTVTLLGFLVKFTEAYTE